MSKQSKNWFEVDRDGLQQVVARRGKSFIIAELVQNAWDEPGVTEVSFSLEASDRRGLVELSVVDDAPDGFKDLRDAYTLFAPSKKKDDPTKRGRFNFGEKLVLSLCKEAEVVSTTGGVRFSSDGRKTLNVCRDKGTEFSATVRMTKAEMQEAIEFTKSLIPPTGIKTVVNGQTLEHSAPVAEASAYLPTDIADEDGVLKRTYRTTPIFVYRVPTGEKGRLCEMGIPVCDIQDPWIIDVRQRVPLGMERDSVTPGYLQDVRVAVLEATVDILDVEEVSDSWIDNALEDPGVNPAAVEQVMLKRYGEKTVVYDPSDQEANNTAVAKGYTVLHGRTFSAQAWHNVRKANVVEPAGRLFPTPSLAVSADGTPPVPQDQWPDTWTRVADYCQRFARETLGEEIAVHFMPRSYRPKGIVAAYGSNTITWVTSHAERYFSDPQMVTEILIHELGHHYEANHLSEGFHDALCRIGAKAFLQSWSIGGM